MSKQLISALAVGALILAGCGDEDGGSGSDLSEAQQGAADQAMLIEDEADVEFDRGCIEEIAAELTEEDAQAIVDAGPDGDARLSAEGEALQESLFGCMDQGDIIGLFVQSIEEAGQEVDDACVQDVLSDVDLAPLLESGEPPDEVIEAVFGCVQL